VAPGVQSNEELLMSKAAMNLQDSFLNQVRRENSEVNVLLVNGKTLRGIVKGFDNFTVILNSRGGQHLIYKHAIAQLVTQRALAGRREGDETASTDHEAGATNGSSPERREHGPRPQQQQQQPKKETFNSLDLSQIKLSEVPSE
jgi:host factor-I protein